MRNSLGFRSAGGLALVLAVAIACIACAGASPTVDRWLGRTAAPAGSGKAFYSAVDGLPVYAGPARTSAVVGRLSLHERVSRSKLEGGYAYVQAERSGLQGWVDNAQLVWRLPTAGAPPVAGEPAQEPGAQTRAPAQSDATATGDAVPPTAPPAPAAVEPEPATAPPGKPEAPPTKPSKPAPSVFDPF